LRPEKETKDYLAGPWERLVRRAKFPRKPAVPQAAHPITLLNFGKASVEAGSDVRGRKKTPRPPKKEFFRRINAFNGGAIGRRSRLPPSRREP